MVALSVGGGLTALIRLARETLRRLHRRKKCPVEVTTGWAAVWEGVLEPTKVKRLRGSLLTS